MKADGIHSCTGAAPCPCSSSGICNCSEGYTGDKCTECDTGYTLDTSTSDIICTSETNCTAGFYPSSTCDIRKHISTYFIYISSTTLEIILACNCDTSGTIGGSASCNDAGVCSCIDNVSGNKCDACSPGWYGFPSCQGEIYAKLSVGNYFWLLIFWNYLQNVFVMRMVQ